MLDINEALELMKKYGYSSTSVHPYIYQSGEDIGLCYTYIDEDYGSLERIKIFDSLESFEDFLKQLDWVKKNGLHYHVRMCLDNYEAINPKTLFLRNEKLMVEGEMDDIELFDQKEKQRDQMDEASKILYEAGDLLLVYEEIKKRQLQYLLKIIELKNQLRQKYYDLQKSVDEYNKIKIEREFVKLPEVPDNGGIDITMEVALKDKYNMYITQVPSVEEATALLKEVWDLNKNLELNTNYYDAVREETEIRNEMKIVEKKQELMDKLNENLKPLFGVDLMSRFKKINKSIGGTINSISTSIVQEKISQVTDKYDVYPQLNLMYVSDYLREAIQNSNYADLAIKYGKNTTKDIAEKSRTPLNEIASSLLVQYKNSLSVEEQAILVVYSNEKLRKICDAILAIPKFQTFTAKQIAKKVSGIKGFSKLKSECYIGLKNRIDNPLNQTIKNSLFKNYDFTTFETFIGSLMRELYKLKQVNNKMSLTGDINMYIPVKNVDDLKKREFILVTNDINSLLVESETNKTMVGITLLKEKLPVLYSPYFLDLGDMYSKDASPKLEIREMVNFELLIDVSDIIINVDKTKVNVTKYVSSTEVEGNVSIVRDIKANGKTTFVKYAFLPNGPIPVEEAVGTPGEKVPEQPVTPQPVAEEPVPAAPVVPPVISTPEPKVEVPKPTPEEVEKPKEVELPKEEVKEEPKKVEIPKEEPKEEIDEKESEDLDKLLDTLATSIPKDLSKDLEDTNKMELFQDLKEDKKVEKKEAVSKPVKEAVEVKPAAVKTEAKPALKKNEGVKQQLVKKVITNPDGTKKVVMVRRIFTTKPKAEGESVPDQAVKKVVRKIGVPVDTNNKEVVKTIPKVEEKK